MFDRLEQIPVLPFITNYLILEFKVRIMLWIPEQNIQSQQPAIADAAGKWQSFQMAFSQVNLAPERLAFAAATISNGS